MHMEVVVVMGGYRGNGIKVYMELYAWSGDKYDGGIMSTVVV